MPSFNDDIQGTAAVVVGGVLAGLRAQGNDLAGTRAVLVGAGAAGIGIARLLRLAMLEAGSSEAAARRAVVLVDSHGLVHDRREDLDATKRVEALPAADFAAYGFTTEYPTAVETIERVRPTVLAGTTGVGGSFDEALLRAAGAAADRPMVLALSNPTANAEAVPADILRWTGGRALVATGLAVRRRRGGWAHDARSGRPTTSSSSRGSGSVRSRPRREPSPTGCSCSRPGRWLRT